MENINFPLKNVNLSPIFELTSLFLLANGPLNVEGVWNRITLTSMTGNWYLKLTYYEIIFLELILFQIFVLRYVEILPVSLNGLFGGDPAGRKRKKRSHSSHLNDKCDGTNHNLKDLKILRDLEYSKDLFLSILRRLDEKDCFLRTLCEISKSDIKNLSSETHLMLKALKRSGQKRLRREALVQPNNDTIIDRGLLYPFEEAAVLGHNFAVIDLNMNKSTSSQDTTTTSNHSNKSSNKYHEILANQPSFKKGDLLCEEKYALCPLTRQEILGYFQDINELLS